MSDWELRHPKNITHSLAAAQLPTHAPAHDENISYSTHHPKYWQTNQEKNVVPSS